MDVLDRHGLLVTRYTWQVTDAETQVALAVLDGLRVRADDWQPKTADSRQALSLSWARVAVRARTPRTCCWPGRWTGKTGCTTPTVTPSSTRCCPRTCTPGAGSWFEQVEDRAEYQVQLDHVVSLADAYRSGGYRWKPGGCSWPRLYNDDGNIVAVSRSVNAAKGDKNAAAWLPDNPVHDYRQRFVVLQIQVKTRYHLSVTDSERAAMRVVLMA